MAHAHQRHHRKLQPFAGVHGQHLDGVGGGVEGARAFAHLVRQAALAQHAGAFVHLAVVAADDGHVAPGVAFLVGGAQQLGHARGFVDRNTPEADRRINDTVIQFVDKLVASERVSYAVSDYLFFGSASPDAAMAGIRGALIGSILTLFICVLISFPLGVATAVYLEEIAPKNRFTEIIEININNLAAVPSVVFGIMGLAVFIVLFGMPRSIPLVGGIVLALMTLPTIIISSRAAIRSVPPSIRDAALGVGASKMQTIFHHVIPLAMPGMLTGTIIGMAQALGETAPLLMIGMVAFIVDVPGGVMDPGTVLPVQIFMWADFAERMFVQKTSAAIIVLLAFLIVMNASAIWLRKKLERRW